MVFFFFIIMMSFEKEAQTGKDICNKQTTSQAIIGKTPSVRQESGLSTDVRNIDYDGK